MCLKINWSVKTPWHRPSMGVARSRFNMGPCGHVTTAWVTIMLLAYQCNRLLVSACLIWSLGPSSVELWIRKNRCKVCIRHGLSFEVPNRPPSWTKHSPPLQIHFLRYGNIPQPRAPKTVVIWDQRVPGSQQPRFPRSQIIKICMGIYRKFHKTVKMHTNRIRRCLRETIPPCWSLANLRWPRR